MRLNNAQSVEPLLNIQKELHNNMLNTEPRCGASFVASFANMPQNNHHIAVWLAKR